MIERVDGRAVIGFRGSESYDIQQLILDWGLADLGLLNSHETIQKFSETAMVDADIILYLKEYIILL